MKSGPYGFDDSQHFHATPFFPVEWMLPIAYALLGALLFWRLRRDCGSGGAVVRAAFGAWLGTLLPAGLILIVPIDGAPVLWMELALLLLTMVVAATGGLQSDYGDNR